MTQLKLAVVAALAIAVLTTMADDHSVKYDSEGFPELTQLSEEGFVDMVFRIRETHLDENGWYTLTADAKHEGETVGLSVAIQPNMRPGIVDDKIDNTAFYSQGVLLLRDGVNSDRLLRAFESLYGQPARKSKFRERAELTSFSLMGDPQKLKTSYVKFKIFHDDQDEHGEYFELYLHINLPGGFIAMNEKDQEYRPKILKGLVAGQRQKKSSAKEP